jgi:hypothetical protein
MACSATSSAFRLGEPGDVIQVDRLDVEIDVGANLGRRELLTGRPGDLRHLADVSWTWGRARAQPGSGRRLESMRP